MEAIKVQINCHPYSVDNNIKLDKTWQSTTIDVGIFKKDDQVWINAYSATIVKLKELISTTYDKLVSEYTCSDNQLESSIKHDMLITVDQTDVNRSYNYMLYLEDVYKKLFLQFGLDSVDIRYCVYPGMLRFDNAIMDIENIEIEKLGWNWNIFRFLY
jgi:hypothetical protein